MLKIFNELIKPKKTNKQTKKILKLFGTSLRYYKHISGSITHLSNKQNRKKMPRTHCKKLKSVAWLK